MCQWWQKTAHFRQFITSLKRFQSASPESTILTLTKNTQHLQRLDPNIWLLPESPCCIPKKRQFEEPFGNLSGHFTHSASKRENSLFTNVTVSQQKIELYTDTKAIQFL